ncbi:MAG: hypothetical protein A2V21_308305 [Deltaproteobacteria bacterium GWC2_55_46]|nr:MAG: hypothetical protein A2Z79_02405 [Deltaproteobacteria bacterium GWA2_55_82]OGQ62667.1 MAG: hypothetical protein A3I81_09225 [Deltaproteobacteria bacterium RIFCSPLOWO2_02_FULL_55_12]OIJ74259.1 MAG: hypothetical protein A2V21_308305 [Deltaproteobacteria bacterium GWC2_55_46]
MGLRPYYIVPAILLALGAAAAPSFGATAEENYKFYCAQCHGTHGRGDGPNATKEMPVSPRDHTSAVEMSKLTDEDIINAIAEGGPATSKSSLMPPFGKTLTRGEITELKAYLRKLCNCKGK